MEFLQQILGLFVDLVRQFTWRDAVDVLAVSFIIYSGIKLVRESRAEQLVKGLLLVVVIFGLANYLQLYMLKGLLSTFFQFTIVALLIVFQPELRRALEQMGRNGVSKPFTLAAAPKDAEAELQLQRKGILAVGEACMRLQKLKMGALSVFEWKLVRWSTQSLPPPLSAIFSSTKPPFTMGLWSCGTAWCMQPAAFFP